MRGNGPKEGGWRLGFGIARKAAGRAEVKKRPEIPRKSCCPCCWRSARGKGRLGYIVQGIGNLTDLVRVVTKTETMGLRTVSWMLHLWAGYLLF